MEAIIVTGGKGTRMKPYTQILPKGLLPVGEVPILDIIVRQLHYYGFQSITMACGYLAPLIQTYFGDGSKWHVDIRYVLEHKPLGTAGPLANIKMNQPFLVINCDVLTSLDLKAFYDFHCAKESLITIASQKKNLDVDLGVLETEEDRITKFLEKPKQSAHVSMGIYMMDPALLGYIPKNQFFDVPDLIQVLLRKNQPVRHFENDAFWLDIGRPPQFREANDLFPTIKHQLLPGETE
ncbi:sugar phosphate nucleotidyltransferase [Caldalkalibacillus salinus]|uniref:sugar phosphate nucleotidyltransferase n=1 Tax=Caldalkalibacillus salinus TaxID=2803787 RepID=UPI001923EA79|nr:sugar phosphate nucleotidyltransferase [Caldalkalibacillus salinus]